MLDERAQVTTADTELETEPETLEELADLAVLDHLEAEQDARMGIYHAVKLNHQNIACWLAAHREAAGEAARRWQDDDAPSNQIPQPPIEIVDVPNRPQRIGSFWPLPLRPNVPRQPAQFAVRMCRNCGEHPASNEPVGPWPTDLLHLCDRCRRVVHHMVSKVYWRHPHRSVFQLMQDLVRFLDLPEEN
jgi:hypothetical protein